MLNRSASLAMSTSILKALPGKPDIKRHSPSILYITCYSNLQNKVLLQPKTCRAEDSIGHTWVISTIILGLWNNNTVKPVLSGHSKRILKLVFKTNYR